MKALDKLDTKNVAVFGQTKSEGSYSVASQILKYVYKR
jgi:hypothetical protein